MPPTSTGLRRPNPRGMGRFSIYTSPSLGFPHQAAYGILIDMPLSHDALLEALLFAEGGPLSMKRACALLDISMPALEAAIGVLSSALTTRGLTLVVIHDEMELRTSAGAADVIKRLRESDLSRDLGKASLETLALILYRGTATRTEIDWVRGVNSGAALRALMLRGLIERSEDQTDKRRARFQATVDALAHLGVSRPEELPRYAELMPLVRDAEARAEVATAALTDV